MPLTNPNDIYDEKYLVCCGFHVRNVVTFLAVIMILLDIVSIFTNGLFSAIVAIVVEGLTIFADKAEQPWAYVPFLIFTAIGIIAFPILIIIIISQGDNNFLEIPTTAFVILAAFTVVGVSISIYRWYLVYRARQYMINEVISGNTQRRPQNTRETV